MVIYRRTTGPIKVNSTRRWGMDQLCRSTPKRSFLPLAGFNPNHRKNLGHSSMRLRSTRRPSSSDRRGSVLAHGPYVSRGRCFPKLCGWPLEWAVTYFESIGNGSRFPKAKMFNIAFPWSATLVPGTGFAGNTRLGKMWWPHSDLSECHASPSIKDHLTA